MHKKLVSSAAAVVLGLAVLGGTAGTAFASDSGTATYQHERNHNDHDQCSDFHVWKDNGRWHAVFKEDGHWRHVSASSWDRLKEKVDRQCDFDDHGRGNNHRGDNEDHHGDNNHRGDNDNHHGDNDNHHGDNDNHHGDNNNHRGGDRSHDKV
ncbi:hypothetical protein [Georgenia yuyongxinii]|uniref:hypothetical protein n=1 Tax=Georgenia yuyongxinii TaxID=2589797 RepID=UPI00163D4F43|nr:hypothetical protein [Georgenia yuyongxinii]